MCADGFDIESSQVRSNCINPIFLSEPLGQLRSSLIPLRFPRSEQVTQTLGILRGVCHAGPTHFCLPPELDKRMIWALHTVRKLTGLQAGCRGRVLMLALGVVVVNVCPSVPVQRLL